MMPLAGKHITEWKFASREGIVPVRSGTGRTRMDPTSHSHTRCRVPMKWKPTKKIPRKTMTTERKSEKMVISMQVPNLRNVTHSCSFVACLGGWRVFFFFLSWRKWLYCLMSFSSPAFAPQIAPNCPFAASVCFELGTQWETKSSIVSTAFVRASFIAAESLEFCNRMLGGGRKNSDHNPYPPVWHHEWWRGWSYNFQFNMLIESQSCSVAFLYCFTVLFCSQRTRNIVLYGWKYSFPLLPVVVTIIVRSIAAPGGT